ncbi:tetratricopeptide repeat-containing sensor histidine kinase [Lacinutrix jangbogonensis]|uniref:tetratricopeptide repeat-containing sensor histidine kinase n=1 Tax=Lacinutrix jangbogonensis TaxID=1469557 RepID=UPI00053E0ECC|nr:tetratricopeptide repeat protein [Lacinutrix jangbogonensis]
MKHLNVSKAFYNTNLDSAEIYANKAIEYSEKNNFYKGLGYGYSNLGIIYEYRGEYAQSILNNEKSKEFFIKGNLTKGIAISNQYLGIGYFYLSEYEKSLTYYFEALKSYEKLDFKEGIAGVNNNIGAVYEYRKDFPAALKFYNKSYLLKKELQINSSSSLNNIANVYCEQGDFEKGLEYFLKSEKEKSKFNNSSGKASLYTNISGCYIGLSEFSKAKNYILKAIKIDTTRNNLYGYSYDLQVYGDLENARNNKQLALNKYLKAYEIAKSKDYLDLQINCTSKISDLYLSLGDHEKAFQFQNESLQIKDKVHFQENKEAIANLNVVYETEKKTQEIALLSQENKLKDVTIERNRAVRLALILGSFLLLLSLFLLYNRFQLKAKTNQILNTKNKELKELNATKDKLFSIVAHDLKNPVSAFKTLTENMSKGFDKIPQNMLLKLISQLRDSSTQLYDVLTNLLIWSNSQRNNIKVDKIKVIPKILVDEIIGMYQINSSSKSIKITNKIDTELELIADKEILHTAFRNIIMNAIKFSPENGSIEIYKKENSIIIEDNGIGMSEKDINKLFDITKDVASIGDSAEKGTGLGLLLCKELLDKANIKIKVESALEKGTKVILIF